MDTAFVAHFQSCLHISLKLGFGKFDHVIFVFCIKGSIQHPAGSKRGVHRCERSKYQKENSQCQFSHFWTPSKRRRKISFYLQHSRDRILSTMCWGCYRTVRLYSLLPIWSSKKATIGWYALFFGFRLRAFLASIKPRLRSPVSAQVIPRLI